MRKGGVFVNYVRTVTQDILALPISKRGNYADNPEAWTNTTILPSSIPYGAVRLAIRQTPDSLAVHHWPFHNGCLRFHRTPRNPTPTVSRSHLRFSLCPSGGRVPSNHWYPQLIWQQSCADLETLRGYGSPHFDWQSRRCDRLEHLLASAGSEVLARVWLLLGYLDGGDRCDVVAALGARIAEQEEGPDEQGGSERAVQRGGFARYG
jgi:hypothetical protein